MKRAALAGGLLGITLLVALGLHADLTAMMRALRTAGWPLLVLVPWRLVFFLLYALGWRALLRLRDPARRAGIGYLTWVTAVREAADRLLPLPAVGGGLLGVRLLAWRELPAAAAGASILAEMLVTFAASYVFTGIGLYLLFTQRTTPGNGYRTAAVFALALAVPLAAFVALRSGWVFRHLHKLIGRWPGLTAGATRLDDDLRALLRDTPRLLLSGGLQLLALISGSMEVWLALRLFGHPAGVPAALIMESLTQAVRSVAFFVPAAIGIQEAGLVVFGHALGIGAELSLAVSMAKRIREAACGVPALLSWQYLEGHRAHRPREESYREGAGG